MKRITLSWALLLGASGAYIFGGGAYAQGLPQPSLREQILSLPSAFPLQEDSLASPVLSASKSPALAMGLSAVLPGAGQVYVHRYWTIPIIYGFGALFVYNWKEADDLYQQYRKEYEQSVADGDYGGSGDPTLKSTRDFYRNERDRFGVYLLLTYLLNIADAYVGASLYNFDVSENLGPTQEFRVTVAVPFR
jgi:hypothetical protein